MKHVCEHSVTHKQYIKNALRRTGNQTVYIYKEQQRFCLQILLTPDHPTRYKVEQTAAHLLRYLQMLLPPGSPRNLTLT